MSDDNRFAMFMKNLRVDANLSVENAARKIGVGISEIENWENGKLLPSEFSAERISQVYGIDKNEWLEVLRNEVEEAQRLSSKTLSS